MARWSRVSPKACSSRAIWSTRPPTTWAPPKLEQAARDVAERIGATITVTTGEALLKNNYPMIHAVGRASTREPRLIDFTWGADRHPKVTLVGKGVCFDTGGLDLKNSSGMLTMKKDMGGAACVLGLAQAIMDAKLPVRLRVMIPAVENSVSGASYRPGRCAHQPQGPLRRDRQHRCRGPRRSRRRARRRRHRSARPAALPRHADGRRARRAPAWSCRRSSPTTKRSPRISCATATAENDPLWRLPLWRSYEPTVDSAIADVNNAPDYGLAGAITAALFLNRFITKTERWAHFDIPAWTDRPKPGRRKGGEASGLRAMFAVIAERYT